MSSPGGGLARRIPLNQSIASTEPDFSPVIFLRLFTSEEVTLPAATYRDAERIVAWASRAPRLQRQAAARRQEHRDDARLHLFIGASLFAGGWALLAYTYANADPGEFYVIPFGAIIIGGSDLLYGLLKRLSS